MILKLEEHRNNPALDLPHFPTCHQAVIWRNWGLAPIDRIAATLGAAVGQIREAAGEMGLVGPAALLEARWLERGYLTIIRLNWHLLPFAQLLQLLGWSEEKLTFVLKEDDFLWMKLGSFKPCTEPVRYRQLSPEERERTQRIKEIVAARFGLDIGEPIERFERPFDFLDRYKTVPQARASYREAEAWEVRLDVAWVIRCSSGQRLLPSAAERFVRKHEQIWGAKWAIDDGSAAMNALETWPCLRISISPDHARRSESHTISVQHGSIAIDAADEAGAMRGLQWLADRMEKDKAPYIVAGEYRRKAKIDTRIIYSYSAVYGDPLLEAELDPYPEELLEKISDMGINGIWLQSVLYSLVPWEPAPELSNNWEKRINGLRSLVRKASRYGIGVYLYCNEPRSMPVSFFADHPEWQGHTEDGQAMLCTSHPDVRKMLGNAVSRLFQEVPDLAGLFTISMSENWTHCYSRTVDGRTNCPRCRERSPAEVTAEVNRIIAEGAFRSKPDARILCWTWGWDKVWGWSDNDIPAAIEAFPDHVIVMCTSEEAIPTNIAGVPGQVIDYSMSVIGPGEKSRTSWQTAKARGLRTAAKVQLNNTWECSAVPFLPVFQLLEEHLSRLDESGINALLLSWTLGGYPSVNLELAAEYYWEMETDAGADAKRGGLGLLQGKFGTAAGQAVYDASALLGRAFRQFPFDLNALYFAPQNYGPANLFHLQPSGLTSTMLGFPYDDLQTWRGIYPEAAFAGQFKKLTNGWKTGLRLLQKARKLVLAEALPELEEIVTMASAAYLHFRSAYLQIEFVRTRNRYLSARSEDLRQKARGKLINLIREESDLVRQLYDLVIRDSRIGFEASNHYYYTVQSLKEKELNCRFILDQLTD